MRSPSAFRPAGRFRWYRFGFGMDGPLQPFKNLCAWIFHASAFVPAGRASRPAEHGQLDRPATRQVAARAAWRPQLRDGQRESWPCGCLPYQGTGRVARSWYHLSIRMADPFDTTRLTAGPPFPIDVRTSFMIWAADCQSVTARNISCVSSRCRRAGSVAADGRR
jgi:hypothetical protein